MNRLLFIVIIFTAVSCSGGNESSPGITSGMSVDQKDAQTFIKNDIKRLQAGQYAISEDELNLLSQEGLISQEELNSLAVVK